MVDWDADQRRVLAHEAGPLLVLGQAGTGKTMLFTELLARALGAGRPALGLCLTRQAASAARDQIVRATGRTTLQPQVMTLHAFCLALLARYDEPGARELLTAPQQEVLLREVLAGHDGRWPQELADAAGTRAFALQVRGALARARQWGLEPAQVASFAQAAGDEGWASLALLAEAYLARLERDGLLDYAELLQRVRALVEQPEVAQALRGQIAALYVDEWAEMDASAMELVRALVPFDRTLVAFADPDTAIYRFRGAHPRPVEAFGRLVGGDVMVLGHQHRLRGATAAAAASVAERLPAPLADPALAAAYRRPEAAEGEASVEWLTSPYQADEAAVIAARLREAHLDAGLAWSDMAVLVRAGRTQIALLARALGDAGVPVEVAGDEIGLADELAVRPLLLALDVAAGGAPDADQARRLLMSGWGGLDAVALRSVARGLRARAVDEGREVSARSGDELVAEALGKLIDAAQPTVDASDDAHGGEAGDDEPREVPDDEAGDVPAGEADAVLDGEAEVPSRQALAFGVLEARAAALGAARRALASGKRVDEVLWGLWSASNWGASLRAEALGGGEGSARAHHDLDAVIALMSLAGDSEAAGTDGVHTFTQAVAAQQIPADDERESAVRGRGVRLLTAHRAKGKAWRLVVLAGVQEGAWPDVRRRGSLFDPARLSPEGLLPGETTRELVAAERRLFLLACTRASERLLVTAVAGTEGEADQPSRFCEELGVAPRAALAPERGLHTLRALVAELRQVASDPAASPELRAAAVRRLARLADATDHLGRPVALDADPQRWWGLKTPTSFTAPIDPQRLAFSPSQVHAVLECPRQFFLDREAHASGPTGATRLLGSVIHALAEHVSADGLDADEAFAKLDDVWDQLPFPAPWFSASEREAARAAVLRFLTWQEERGHVEVVGVEVPFSVEVEVDGQPVTLRGSIDRLEKDADGSLRVIDFKAGSSAPPTKAEAAASEQLGVYQLAIAAGAFRELAGSDRPGGAQLVYLRHPKGTADETHPKTFEQPSLTDAPHLGGDDGLDQPTWVHERLSRARSIITSGRFDASPGEQCRWCSFASSCPATSKQVIA